MISLAWEFQVIPMPSPVVRHTWFQCLHTLVQNSEHQWCNNGERRSGLYLKQFNDLDGSWRLIQNKEARIVVKFDWGGAGRGHGICLKESFPQTPTLFILNYPYHLKGAFYFELNIVDFTCDKWVSALLSKDWRWWSS